MAEFDWLPYLKGKYMTYYQIMALILSAVSLIFSIIFFIFYMILGHLQKFQKLKNILFNSIFYALSSIPLICMGFDVIYLLEGIIGMSLILILRIYLSQGRQNWGDWMYEHKLTLTIIKFFKLSFKNSPITRKKIIKALVLSTLLNLLMYKTCMSFYNDEIGIRSKLLGVSINTYITRFFQLHTSCPPGPPCQIYATVPEDPYQAFFLNIHTHTDVSNVTVFYQQLNTDTPEIFNFSRAETYHYQGLEWRTSRNVHSALIMGLKSNTKYLTKVFYQGKYWTNAIYKTLPNDPDIKVRMINGGDSGYCPGAVKLSKIVATLNPDIFFMGGDIAYDNNIPACSYTWDYFLKMYGQITATLGYLMPIVTTVGNHDAGINQLPGINITVNNKGPAFLIYFPLHYDRDSNFQVIKRVPPIEHRRTVTSFTFSHIHFLTLDSGYLHGFDGWQKSYMISSLTENRDKVKFVNYHVPIYGSCQGFDRSPQRFLYALFHWVPIFDKFKIITVFQNHVHAFKRTKPLRSSSPVESGGTVYLGDGAYGAFNQLGCHPDASIDIFQKVSSNNNFWMSDVYKDRVEHTCYNSNGKIIDKFTQNISEYVLKEEEEMKQYQIQQLLPNKQKIFAKKTIDQ